MADSITVTDLLIKVRSDVSDAKKGLNEASNSTLGLIGKGAALATGFLAATGVLDLATASLSQWYQGAMDAQVAQQTTNDILARGNVGFETSAKYVSDLATQYSNLTGIDDDVVHGAENIILSYSKIGENLFPQVTQAALDLATRYKELHGGQLDVQGSAQSLAMALQDPSRAMRLLRTDGINLTTAQQAQINTWLKHGQTAKAQGLIMDEVHKQVDGAAAAYGETNQGKIQKFQTTLGNLGKQAMSGLLPVLGNLTDWATSVLPGAFATAQTWLNNMGQAFDYVRTHADQMRPQLALVAGIIGTIVVAAFLGLAGAAWSAAAGVIAATWPVLAIGVAIGGLAAGIIWAYQNWGWFKAAVDIAREALGWLKDRIGDLLGFLGNLIGHLVELRNNLMERLHPAIENVRSKLAELHAWFNDKVLPVLKKLHDFFVTNILPILQQVGQWVKDKLQDKLDNMGKFINGTLLPILGWLADKVGKGVGKEFQTWGNILGNLFGTIGTLLGWLGKLKDMLGKIHIPDFGGVAHNLHIPGFASGTDDAPGGLAYVHKDELIILPQHSRVIPAHETAALLGDASPVGSSTGNGGGYKSANIYVMLNGQQLAAELAQPLVDNIRMHTGLRV